MQGLPVSRIVFPLWVFYGIGVCRYSVSGEFSGEFPDPAGILAEQADRRGNLFVDGASNLSEPEVPTDRVE
jgi:hypothetical protein